MSVVNVRVENKGDFEKMHRAFKRQCADRKVLHECKLHEFYEKPSDKKRKKKKQAIQNRLKELRIKEKGNR